MPGGCWVCNPLCGKCQPPALKDGFCPECNKHTVFKRGDILGDDPLLCKTCGNDLSGIVRPETLLCAYSGLRCTYPCGKAKGKTPTNGYQICLRNTKPAD
jgi:hypothetical protein